MLKMSNDPADAFISESIFSSLLFIIPNVKRATESQDSYTLEIRQNLHVAQGSSERGGNIYILFSSCKDARTSFPCFLQQGCASYTGNVMTCL